MSLILGCSQAFKKNKNLLKIRCCENPSKPWSNKPSHNLFFLSKTPGYQMSAVLTETVKMKNKTKQKTTLLLCKTTVPNLFDTRDRFHGRQLFHRLGLGDGLGMIRVYYIYCGFYFYYYYITFTSDHQALNPGGWGPLVQATVVWYLLWWP